MLYKHNNIYFKDTKQASINNLKIKKYKLTDKLSKMQNILQNKYNKICTKIIKKVFHNFYKNN